MRVRYLGLGLIVISIVACSENFEDPLVDVRTFNSGISGDRTIEWHALASESPAAPGLTVSGDTLTMSLSGFYLSGKRVNGVEYTRVMVPGHSPLTVAGLPELPRIRANLIIPHQAGVDFQVLEEDHYEIRINPPLPSRGDITRDQNPANVPYRPGEFYRTGTIYPRAPALAGDPFIMRDYRGLPIQFQPFIYDRVTGRLKIYTRIKVRFVDQTRMDFQRRESPGFANLYRSTFLNYTAGTRYDQIEEPGRLIIITADAYYDAVQPLRDWKIERGLQTSVVRLSEIGSGAAGIKSFIADEYNSPEGLTYVILVGDSDTVPTLTGTYEGAHSDPSYVMVDGSDFYADLFISRISARSVAEVENQVAKFIGYERDPDPAGAWYTRGIGIASDEGSPADYERADDLRDSLLGYGFDHVAQIYDPGATASQVIAAVNQGASIINYIGHGSGTSWVTTGMDTSDVATLSNGDMLPFIIDVACQNGSFVNHTTCFAESWLRAGSAESPAGAVAMFSASTNASWVPPCVMQSWIVDELWVNELRYTTGSMYFGGAMKVLDQYGEGEGTKLVEQYNIFGDASLMVRTRSPRPIDVQHPDSLPTSGSVDVTVEYAGGGPVSGATVALSNGDLIATAVTGTNGVAALACSGVSGDSVRLTVVGHNLVPYRTEVPVGGGGGNTRPVARAGADQTVNEGDLVALDGSASYDPDGDAITFAWTQTGGPTVTLSGATTAQPTFQAPLLGATRTLTFSLVVDDGDLSSAVDEVDVVVQHEPANQVPVADAGYDQTVTAGDLVTLSGLDSFDPDGDKITFSWSQTAGPSVHLSSASAVQPTFSAPGVSGQTVLTFELTVNDGQLSSAPDSVDVTVNPDSGWDVVAVAGDTPISIPDNDSGGIQSVLTLNGSQSISEMEVEVDITHTYIGDLRVRLQCPDGNLVTLHDRSGGGADDIHQTYPVTGCNGQSAGGVLKLLVSDHARIDTGTLNYWEVRANVGAPPSWEVDELSADTPISIPDDDSSGVASSIQVGNAGTIAAMEVEVDITHTWIGDLKVVVECPGGGSATLHDRTGSSADDIHQTYSVSACNGQSAAGMFNLRVSDHAGYDVGSLDSWRLRIQLGN